MGNYTQNLSIRSWKEDDRPREKLINKGRTAVSDAELIAILIGSGTSNESAVDLSKRILSTASNNLNELGKFSIADLQKFKGIGKAKAVTISAALELGLRRAGQQSLVRDKISSSQSAFEILHPILGHLPHEEFWIIYLNNSNKVLHKEQLSKGGITGTLVDIRLAFKKALELSAVGVILAHNHPSATLKPSESDIRLTQKMRSAGESLDITVLDHLIISEKAYFSFADEQLL